MALQTVICLDKTEQRKDRDISPAHSGWPVVPVAYAGYSMHSQLSVTLCPILKLFSNWMSGVIDGPKISLSVGLLIQCSIFHHRSSFKIDYITGLLFDDFFVLFLFNVLPMSV